VREICMLRSTRRGLETWHGRDGVTLADERARQRGTQTSTYTGAPVLDPTWERPEVKFLRATRQSRLGGASCRSSHIRNAPLATVGACGRRSWNGNPNYRPAVLAVIGEKTLPSLMPAPWATRLWAHGAMKGGDEARP
jgi:hypothetical protein